VRPRSHRASDCWDRRLPNVVTSEPAGSSETNGTTKSGRRWPDEHALATVKTLGSTRISGNRRHV